MKTLTTLTLAMAVVLSIGCQPKHDVMPKGFRLICNSKQQYAGQRIGSGAIIEVYSWKEPTRQNAIERAWGQYQYEEVDSKKLFDKSIPYQVCP